MFKKSTIIIGLILLLVVAVLVIVGNVGILGDYWRTEKEVKIPEVKISEEQQEIKTPEKQITPIPEKIIVDLKKFNTIEDAILYYLNQYPDEPNILEKLIVVEKFEGDGEYEEEKKLITWIEKADLDNDGYEELAISYLNPYKVCDVWGCKNSFSVFSKKEHFYKKVLTLEAGGPFSSYFIRDVNKDNKLEVVLVENWCGAHTCGRDIHTIQFDGQKWRNLTPNVRISLGEETEEETIKWEDLDNDGSEELILHGGLVGSAGAGMQRAYTDIYAYRDGEYRLIKRIRDPADNIYYLMLDANKALKENNLTEALKLTNKAFQNPHFGVSSGEYADINERDQARILFYAAIEAMLVYLKQSPPNLNSVDSLVEEITQKYNKFDNPYINAAQILRDTYLTTKNFQKACQAMENEILKDKENAEFLHFYGYATEKLDFKDLCPW